MGTPGSCQEEITRNLIIQIDISRENSSIKISMICFLLKALKPKPKKKKHKSMKNGKKNINFSTKIKINF
jgi:hypothetical protein